MVACSASTPPSHQSTPHNTTTISLLPPPPPHLHARQLRFPIGAQWHHIIEQPGLFLIGLTFSLTTIAILQSLHTLYQKIIDSLLEAVALSPGSNQLVIEYGRVRFEFGCTMTPIPKEFLVEYFESKRDAVRRGFAVGYEREWVFNRRWERGWYCYAGERMAEVGREVMEPDFGIEVRYLEEDL
ncbi:MAG: hypothetical protein Q9221_007773 [Calogaya cf. arnoldii]